jgi:hypothetical protein
MTHSCGAQGFDPAHGDTCIACADRHAVVNKRSIVARSHDYAAASDCALYLRDRFHHLLHARFAIEGDRDGMWKLIYLGDLDRVKNMMDLDYTGQVVEVAKAFITGRGGLALPTRGVIL